LPTNPLDVRYDGSTSTVTGTGAVPDQATREKIVVCCGNIASVQHVNDQMTVTHSGDQSEYYTVKKGDTLSKIAQEHYGSATRYSAIFEANKPMLSDPDKIYPGQTLRIPRLS
jgi:nucleoid-associated protein YgaU